MSDTTTTAAATTTAASGPTTTAGPTTTIPPSTTDTDYKAQAKTLTEYSVPQSIADTIVSYQKQYQIPAYKGAGLFLMVFILVIIVMMGVSTIFGGFGWFKTLIIGGFTGNLHTASQIIQFVFLIAALVTVIVYYAFLRDRFKDRSVSLAQTKSAALAGVGVEPFQVGGSGTIAAAPEGLFVNLQPLAVKQAAYIGAGDGTEAKGTFNVQDTESAIQNSLRMGIRAYTLQIDYLDAKKDPAKFDAPGLPTLVFRDDNGVLLSDNGASINAVAKQFATYAFNPDFRAHKQPLILYLHFLRTPDAIRKPEEYLKFLSKVAEALQPLFQYHLNTTPEGNFQRQGLERNLLMTPLSALERKLVVLSNADTALFRNSTALGIPAYDAQNDLDYLVNLRVYALNTAEEGIGIATPPSEARLAHAVVVPLSRLLSMSQKDQDAFGKQGKNRLVIAMPSQLGNPSKEDLQKALETLGVNWVPLNLFEPSMDALKAKLAFWKGEPMSKQKALMLRAISQTPRGAENPM